MEVVLPKEKEYEEIITVVAERYGYYFGKRLLQSQILKKTGEERKKVKEITKTISEKISEYLEKGSDVRSEVLSLRQELAKIREAMKEKTSEEMQKIAILNKALSYLDKIVIPAMFERVGIKIVPRTEVSDYILNAIKTK